MYSSLRNQLFRATLSIAANLAEGSSQRTRKEFARFVNYSLTSCSEVENHLTIARDIKAIPPSTVDSLLTQTITVRRMLYGLHKMLSAQKPKP